MRGILFLEKLIIILHTIFYKIEAVYVRIIYKFFQKSINSNVTHQSLQKISFLLKTDQIIEPYTRQFPKLDIRLPASFRSCLVNRTTMNQTVQMPEWIINHKPIGIEFANQLALKTPEIIQHSISLKELKIKNNTVIKPVSGSSSRGVFIVMDDFRIFEVSKYRYLQSPDELKKALSLHIKKFGDDKWLVEEFITKLNKEPAHDFKCYCFYGQIGIILEIKRYPVLRYCWWDSQGLSVEQAEKPGVKLFKGDGVRINDLLLAKRISLEIPVPFIRIDFLKGKDDLYFGEFTPRPGDFHSFKKSTNYELGHLYLEAEARLNRDLLQGKKFQIFKNLMSKKESFQY